jgi:D-amino peptidase
MKRMKNHVNFPVSVSRLLNNQKRKGALLKIYIMTDMEGCAGILNHDDWVLPSGHFYDKGREILTGEVNAAIEGFLEGGADEILVVDGHGAGGINPLTLHPAARLAAGGPKPTFPFYLDADFDGAACVGQHAKAGTPRSHITHTEWFSWIDLTVNGRSIGEYGTIALCAMELKVPFFFAAGEEAFCREAKALTPGVETVSVKQGVNPDGLDALPEADYRRAKLAAIHLSPIEARRRIREGALLAITRLQKRPRTFRYAPLKKPYLLRRKLRQAAGQPPLVQIARHPTSIIGALNTPWQNETRPQKRRTRSTSR